MDKIKFDNENGIKYLRVAILGALNTEDTVTLDYIPRKLLEECLKESGYVELKSSFNYENTYILNDAYSIYHNNHTGECIITKMK